MHFVSSYCARLVLACSLLLGASATPPTHPSSSHGFRGWWNPHGNGPSPATQLRYDYIVVGSGPGGAPLAARLGLAGFQVLVIEAGADQAPIDVNITVPYLNAKASEDPNISWKFLVNHYSDLSQAVRDPKYMYQLPNGSYYTGLSPPVGAVPKGTFYPRSAAVGGCVSHNALIMYYPLANDFDVIANLTNDESWLAVNMRKYWERLEDNQYVANGTPGHGFSGWLQTNRVEESVFFTDSKVYPMLKAAATLAGQVVNSISDLVGYLNRDLNVAGPAHDNATGVYNTPLNMDQYKRSSPRNFLVDTAQALQSGMKSRGRIDIRTNCFATKVIFAPGTTRVIGVEFLDGVALYKADPRANGTRGTPGVAFANKETIISGGAYNTPQLLKLSGIGPATELRKFNIPVVIDLPGVGENLQDRYENSVIVNTPEPWTVFKGCTAGVNASDPCLIEWQTLQSNKSRYATNGRPVLIPLRSSGALNANNDLVVTGRPGYFGGYFYGYSTIGAKYPNSWSWPVLKAHTQNRAGSVSLLSSNPLDTPNITFNYFSTASPTANSTYDLGAVAEGMKLAKSILALYAKSTNSTLTELAPGPAVQTDAELETWIRDTSWGHHASCSAAIGKDGDEMAVLDGDFRVRGATGLRVVDASVFPTIPGFYIQSSIYMVSEKAADVIVADAAKMGGWNWPGHG